MQKYQYFHWKLISGISALFSFLMPLVATSTIPVSEKVLIHQLGEQIDEMETIIPVMEKSKAIDIALPYFNRYPQFTEQLLGQAVQYFPLIEKILQKYDLPDDLKYIPLFESSFRENAVSPVGATGMWQFMEDTGRKYGLTINREIDERRDFVKSTEAAARFLKSLHDELGNWGLALMAYNGGPYRIKRLIRENNTSDIQVIMNQMPKESQTYLSKMIAAKLIFKTYKFYGLTPQMPDPIDFYTLQTSYIASVDLNSISKEYHVDYTALRKSNPHLKYRKIRNSGQHTINIRIPIYDRKDKSETVFRQQSFYISSQEQLEQLASMLQTNIRKIALSNQYFESASLVGKVISIAIPAERYITFDQKFGPQPVDFLTKDFDDIANEKILSKVIMASSKIRLMPDNKTFYYLRPSETLVDVAKKLQITLTQIKDLNPGMNLYKSNRFYIPINTAKSTDVVDAI